MKPVGAAPPSEPGLSGGAKAGLAVGALVVLVLMIMILSKVGGGGSGGSGKDSAKAREVWEHVESQQGKVTPKEWLDILQRAKRETLGTEYEARISALIPGALAAVDAAEKQEKVGAELSRLVEEAASAKDPAIYDPLLRELRERAKAEAPALVEKVDAAILANRVRGLMRELDQVDVSAAVNPPGYERVKGELAAIEKKAAALGPAGKPVLEALAAKRKEADAKFQAGAESELAELNRRVDVFLKDQRFEEAAQAVKALLEIYKDTPTAAKIQELAQKVEKAQKDFDAAWIRPADKDWTAVGAVTVKFNGNVMSISNGEAPARDVNDNSRRLICGGLDRTMTDYMVDFEINIQQVGGGLLVHLSDATPPGVNIAAESMPTGGIALNTWFSVRVKVVGTKLWFGVPPQLKSADIPAGSGGFGLIVFSGAQYQVRGLRYMKLPK